MKTLNISCRKAAEFMCKKEERSLTFWQKFQLSYHLLVCGLCRRYQQQDQWLKSNITNVEEHCKGCLSETDKQQILEKLRQNAS
ncbi:MAG TPA: hypothetical protein VF145_12220 [Chitinophagaceae bacterium]